MGLQAVGEESRDSAAPMAKTSHVCYPIGRWHIKSSEAAL